MRVASGSHLLFSITMIGLGVVGLLYPDFVPVWSPVPASFPGRAAFVYLGPLISLASGIGLLIPRVTNVATRLLLTSLLLWLLLFRLPNFVFAPRFPACWSVFRSQSYWLRPGSFTSGSAQTGIFNTSA